MRQRHDAAAGGAGRARRASTRRSYGPYAEADGAVTAAISRAIRATQGAPRAAPLPAVGRRGRARRARARRRLRARRPRRRGSSTAGWRMTGVEPSADACAAAARARRRRARRARSTTVALEPAAYDLAVFQHSLEHTTEPLARPRSGSRAALRAGRGRRRSRCPNFGGWQARRFGGRWYHLDLPRHRTHFTERGLRALLERAGLRVAATRPRRPAPSGCRRRCSTRSRAAACSPAAWALRIASGLCVLALPLARLANRLGGGGDQLHVVATAGPAA